MGVDFYIDGCRYLSDKVTCTKIFVEVWNRNSEKIFAAESALPDLDSMSFNPVYSFKREFRAQHIDPTSLVLLTLVTWDKASN